VRELENIIERSVILSQGPILTVPLGELSLSPQDSFNDGTLETLRRETIVRVLRETGGVLSGPAGAAARLGLKRQRCSPECRSWEFPAKSMRTNNATKSMKTNRLFGEEAFQMEACACTKS